MQLKMGYVGVQDREERAVCAMFGNPGVGKSTLLNALMDQEDGADHTRFKSGVSVDGSGITREAQEVVIGDQIFIDTPGLADPYAREQAGAQITAALKKNAKYKMCFVLTLQSGRIVAQDMTTLCAVLKAIEANLDPGFQLPFYVIFNKLLPGELKNIEANWERYLEPCGVRPKAWLALP
jgi:GTP-binding protein EngB required for normal cell division